MSEKAIADKPLNEKIYKIIRETPSDMPERLQAACEAAGHPLTLRMQPGHDHSYYFIATFLGDHFDHHGAALAAGPN